jgi:hypothetical protein
MKIFNELKNFVDVKERKEKKLKIFDSIEFYFRSNIMYTQENQNAFVRINIKNL